MSKRRNRNRKGFTLMEILLVTAILVAMVSMASYAYVSMQRNMTAKNTRTEIGLLENACTAYYSSVSAFPSSLRDLQVMPQGMDQVTWGGPFLDQKKGSARPLAIGVSVFRGRRQFVGDDFLRRAGSAIQFRR